MKSSAWRTWLPSAEALKGNRWLRWIGPALHHPRLWHLNRRGVALGLALGLFFGLLIPIAQIPLAGAAAVLLRANVPMAVASTLVTNPVTFGPVYYAAWRTGIAILGDDGRGPPPVVQEDDASGSWWSRVWQRVRAAGKPLLLGLAIFATGFGLLGYLIVTLLWRLRVVVARRRRRRGYA
ncbi:DUF2062 domain-containing protein [uncultured Piscinibacter sp.]|uniref:DUF2062 domain-containing protein n=1 Tax=uncultured Piscinibacter sp. TaxID=1131835 RepID=UPI002632FAEE|nr:DUF2062 domain-containing protein [uncultured Piscinibacter sp.]